MRAIVTGGAGFIGGHIVDQLIEMGYEVEAIDNESAISTETFYKNKDVTYHKVDVADVDAMTAIFENLYNNGKNIDYVFHLAAETKIQLAIKDPQKAFQTNVMGTLNLLELSRKHGVKRIIFSSTSAVYGGNETPNVETQTPDCLNHYASSKLCGEEICDLYSSLYNMEIVKLRYFNVYGERMPSRGTYAPVVAIFFKQKQNNEPLSIVGDGKQRRDFVYVKDVVRANIMCALTKNPDILGQELNVGSGKNYNILDIARKVGGEVYHLPPRYGEADTTLASVDKIQSLIGWVPSVDLLDWIGENNG